MSIRLIQVDVHYFVKYFFPSQFFKIHVALFNFRMLQFLIQQSKGELLETQNLRPITGYEKANVAARAAQLGMKIWLVRKIIQSFLVFHV